MSTHGHTAIRNPTGGWSPGLAMDRGRRFVLAVTLLAGLFMTAAGVAVLLAPGWFADTAGFPRHTHLVHHAGALRRARWMTYRMTGAAPRPGWFVPPDQKT